MIHKVVYSITLTEEIVLYENSPFNAETNCKKLFIPLLGHDTCGERPQRTCIVQWEWKYPGQTLFFCPEFTSYHTISLQYDFFFFSVRCKKISEIGPFEFQNDVFEGTQNFENNTMTDPDNPKILG